LKSSVNSRWKHTDGLSCPSLNADHMNNNNNNNSNNNNDDDDNNNNNNNNNDSLYLSATEPQLTCGFTISNQLS